MDGWAILYSKLFSGQYKNPFELKPKQRSSQLLRIETTALDQNQ